ncbi:MAG: hypothetical protein QF436_03390 [Candidatus Woesearchaeota archaeon]|nr:hypothetical protein [Candidatus Woesearchaeota archaeon]MDP7623133.1 hypothetical protein [Candidatus Woesearchaeota archaeon]HJN57115.1 hypothetical protein [Candidatus Woesearchaeota archaeon]
MVSMLKTAKAFAPGNISCIFVIKKGNNPKKSGSLGVGFTVNKGVFVAIKKINNANKKNIIFFNNKKINFPTVDSVIRKLTDKKVKVSIKSQLPLGCGFGISGASAIAAAYALNKLFNLKKPEKELAFMAHVAEVENMTGLGDVTNQYYGGFLIKHKPSYTFEVKKTNIKNKAVYCRYFSGINTKKILPDKKIKNKINQAGLKSLKKIKNLDKKIMNLKNLIRISKEFSIESRLLKNKKVIETIRNIEKNKGNASMIMLGNSIFSDVPFKGSRKLIIKDKGAFTI